MGSYGITVNNAVHLSTLVFIPESGRNGHIHDHRRSKSLSGALGDHIWHSPDCEVDHGLEPVYSYVEMVCEHADMVHGCHLGR